MALVEIKKQLLSLLTRSSLKNYQNIKKVKNIFKNLLNSLSGLITIDSIKKQLTPLLTR